VKLESLRTLTHVFADPQKFNERLHLENEFVLDIPLT